MFYVCGMWAAVSSAFVPWRNSPAPAYVLAAIAFIPIGLCMAGMVAAAVLKTVAEPLRLVLWSYMTWIAESEKKPQLWGIILLLTTITSGLIALLAVRG
jgi:hypothetical protein